MAPSVPHYFLAVPLSDDIRSLLNHWGEEVRTALPFKQWVHPHDYHITLAFLGKASFQQMNQLKKSVSEAVGNHQPFNLKISRPGTFGKAEHPRIFWAGVSDSPALQALQKSISDACQSVGFEMDKRPYRPHITIAKKWDGEQRFNDSLLEEMMQPKSERATWRVHEIVLYQTHLNRTPKYQPLTTFPLE